MGWISIAWSAVTGFFGGSGSKATIILSVSLILAILLGWLFWSRASLQTELAEAGQTIGALQTSNRAQAATIEGMRVAAKHAVQALSDREKEIQSISSQRDKIRKRLSEVMKDEQVRTWADMPIPDSVRGMLLQ